MKNNILLDIEEEVLTIEKEDITKKLVIYNDDINSFQHVILCLIKYCKHSIEQAEQCAMFIHTKGRYSVKTGSYESLKPIKEALTENGLNAKIEE